MAPPLILEPIDAPKSLSHRNIEDEVGQREEGYRGPAMATLKAIALSLTHEDQREEDEEKKEELVELLLLEVYCSFLFQGLFKMELDYSV